MNAKQWTILAVSIVGVVGGGLYAWNNLNSGSSTQNTSCKAVRLPRADDVVVYNDGERSATMARSQYDALSESEKASLSAKHKLLFEKLESKYTFPVPIREGETKVVDDETAQENYAQTGNVAEIVANLSSISEDVLDSIFIDYIGETQDIGMAVVAKDHLSQEAMDTIVTDYVEATEDMGILDVLKDCLSAEILASLDKF